MNVSSGKKKLYFFADVFSKLTTNRCATINVNGQADHNYAWRFSRNEYVIFINRPFGVDGVEANAKVFIETCSTSVQVSNVSFGLFTLFHISFGKNRSLDMELFYGQRGTYRQVSNARSRGIIADC